MGQPDPKPGKRKRKPIRIVDRKATKRAWKGQLCVLCKQPATNPHHVVPKGGPHYGDDVPENLVALCGSGTTGCHGDIEEHRGDARLRLSVYIAKHRPDTLAYLSEKIPYEGTAWLIRNYNATGAILPS